ncbi:MAG: GGDEF domain-containing protein, partial [Fibrobacter sp.]|nr:GGDEF domain-containing protein [Fibrobacter sp.]
TFFIVSGTPEGFSAIWACLLPASGLLLFGRKKGAVLCVIQLLILVFFFETPIGNSFLMYPYTASFKLRFPMLYIAFFALSFLLETIRSVTFDEMKKAQAKYEYLYRHDALTEVYNRYGFNEKMDALLEGNYSGKISMLILDIDHFKQVNDTYGHPFGDVVLKRLAALLVRKSGAEADVCRWGGEEFAVLFIGDADAVAYGNDILNTMRNTPLLVDDISVRITASIGIAIFENNSGVTPAAFVRLADRCLYEAKEKGRNTLVSRQGDVSENVKI